MDVHFYCLRYTCNCIKRIPMNWANAWLNSSRIAITFWNCKAGNNALSLFCFNLWFLDTKFSDNINADNGTYLSKLNKIHSYEQNHVYSISLISASSKYPFMRHFSIKNPKILHGNIIINDLKVSINRDENFYGCILLV